MYMYTHCQNIYHELTINGLGGLLLFNELIPNLHQHLYNSTLSVNVYSSSKNGVVSDRHLVFVFVL